MLSTVVAVLVGYLCMERVKAPHCSKGSIPGLVWTGDTYMQATPAPVPIAQRIEDWIDKVNDYIERKFDEFSNDANEFMKKYSKLSSAIEDIAKKLDLKNKCQRTQDDNIGYPGDFWPPSSSHKSNFVEERAWKPIENGVDIGWNQVSITKKLSYNNMDIYSTIEAKVHPRHINHAHAEGQIGLRFNHLLLNPHIRYDDGLQLDMFIYTDSNAQGGMSIVGEYKF